MRKPLRHIDGFSLTLQQEYAEKLDERGEELIAKVRDGAHRMGYLIDALLQMSRTTRDSLRRAEYDLSSAATRIMKELRRKDPQRQVDVSIDEGMIVLGDPDLLNSVLENLLGNSWKFTAHREKARIRFGCERVKDGITYYLRDNGVGFDPSFSSKLFQPFQRLHDHTEFEGNGIGLATVQRIIFRHDGKIWADSHPDQGATFYFTLGRRSKADSSSFPHTATERVW